MGPFLCGCCIAAAAAAADGGAGSPLWQRPPTHCAVVWQLLQESPLLTQALARTRTPKQGTTLHSQNKTVKQT